MLYNKTTLTAAFLNCPTLSAFKANPDCFDLMIVNFSIPYIEIVLKTFPHMTSQDKDKLQYRAFTMDIPAELAKQGLFVNSGHVSPAGKNEVVARYLIIKNKMG